MKKISKIGDREVTDFKYSKRKVWRSFVGLCYLLSGRVRLGVGG